MKKTELKQLIHEVLREMEAETDPKNNSGDMKNMASHQKEYGDTILKFKLGGHNKNNTHIVQDFIAQAAHAAAMADLELIHAELEKNGKIGMSMSEPEIKKSEEEINAELDRMAAGDVEPVEKGQMPSPIQWQRMSPEERDKYIKQGSHAAEWNKATEKDLEKARSNAKLKAAKIAAGTYDPNDTSLWTDKDWDEYYAGDDIRLAVSTGEKTKGKTAYRPRFSRNQMSPELKKQGQGAVRAGFSDPNRLK